MTYNEDSIHTYNHFQRTTFGKGHVTADATLRKTISHTSFGHLQKGERREENFAHSIVG